MKGLVLVGHREVEYRTDLPDPVLHGPRDALIAVRLAGICGSDLHPYEGREPVRLGLVPGHEAAGDVVEVGPDVRDFRPGDRVCLPFTTSCDACPPCRGGLSSRCETGQLFGWAPPEGETNPGLQGTQAEFLRVPLADSTLIPLPRELSLADGVLLGDNFATGFYCARRAELAPGHGVALVGCGAVGLSALSVAVHLGSGPVLAVDPVESRREAARRLGARVAVSPEQAAATSAELFGPARGAAGVLEAVGSRDARRLALSLAAPGAVISSVGVATDEFGVTPAELYDRNLTWRAGRCPVRSLQAEIAEALSRGLRIPTEELAPAPPRPLSEGPDAYREFAARTGAGLKPLLAP